MLSPTNFGAFAAAFALYYFLTCLIRSSVGEVLVYTRQEATTAGAERVRAAATAGAMLSFCFVIPLLVAGLVLSAWPVGANLLVVAATLPGIALQDAVRFEAFSVRRASRAVGLAAPVVVCQIGALLTISHAGNGLSWIALLGVLAPPSAQGILLALSRRLIVLSLGRAWFANHARLIRPLMAEFMISSGISMLMIPAAAPIIGFAGVGYVRAAQILLGPINVITGAMPAVVGPALAGTAEREVKRRRHIVLGAVSSLAAIMLFWCLVLVFLPPSILNGVLNGLASEAAPLLPGLTGSMAAGLCMFGASSYLRASGRPRAAVIARAFMGTLTLSGALIGGATGGAVGLATVGGASSLCGGLVVLIWSLNQRSSLSETRGEPLWRDREPVAESK
jgi:hypothetical protein